MDPEGIKRFDFTITEEGGAFRLDVRGVSEDERRTLIRMEVSDGFAYGYAFHDVDEGFRPPPDADIGKSFEPDEIRHGISLLLELFRLAIDQADPDRLATPLQLADMCERAIARLDAMGA